jgi:hypothetical protein
VRGDDRLRLLGRAGSEQELGDGLRGDARVRRSTLAGAASSSVPKRVACRSGTSPEASISSASAGITALMARLKALPSEA